MLIVPAIDLMAGNCVRLLRGNYDTATKYSDDPVAIAAGFEEAGARLIHIVDLDRARGNKSANREVIVRIKRKIRASVEVGGGVRNEEDVRELLGCGVDRIIIGTALVREPARVAGWIAKIGFYAVAGLDAKDRFIKVQGWQDDSGIPDIKCARTLASLGFSEVIYTNIAQDGTLAGPDIESTLEIAKASGLPVILSGGIGKQAHVDAVAKKIGTDAGAMAAGLPGIRGVIIGKAIYEHKVDVAELVQKYQTAAD